MKLGSLFIRLHGSSSWEEVTKNNAIGIAAKSISEPSPKVDAVNVDNINGIIDFSEVFGLYYNNRTIAVTMSATNIADATVQASSALGEFKQKYHGRVVDLSFDDVKPSFYYIGRLSVTADDYKEKFRNIAFSIDADPFRYYASGEYVFTVPMYPNVSSGITGQEQILYSSEGADGANSTASGYSDSGGKKVVVGHTGTPVDASFAPCIYIKLPNISSGSYYVFYADSKDGYFHIEDGDNNNAIVSTDTNGGFRAPSKNLYAALQAKTIRGATFDNIWFRANAESNTVRNGDKFVTPTFDKLEQHVDVLLNGKKIRLHKGESWNPNFVLPAGDSLMLTMSAVSSISYWHFEAERAVL